MSASQNPKSLMETTLKIIIDNVDRYGENLATKLAPEPRQMVLEGLLKWVQRCGTIDFPGRAWLAFPSLLSRKTKLIDTSSLCLMFKQNERVTDSRWGSKFPLSESLQHLAMRAPNLQELKIDHVHRRKGLLGREEITSLSHLQNLSRLYIIHSIVLHSELKEIVKHCRGLQDIEVVELELDGEEKQIDFFDEGFLYHEIRFGTVDISIKLDKDLSKTERHLEGPGPHYHLVGHPWSVENLELLETQPHATELTMICSNFENEYDVVRFPRLPKLRCATFTCLEYKTHALRIFLKINGHLLRRLTIESEYYTSVDKISSISMEEIFGWCSNLEWFSVDLNLDSHNVPIDCLSKLKWFKCIDFGTSDVDISSILSAPQLEGFESMIYNFDLGDRETFFSRIAQREILINLKRFKIHTFVKEDAAVLLEDQLIAAIKSAIPDVEEIQNS
ncbi:Hypothetical predicted protein [Cloeon dipterum]|uniref:Uncharacterized protein n=1 Tax=Cloeon dipterum TaxID=197152 RepID=A0A8S1E4L0_9INSE|nr:Hypothetical predicted protein [Cloeon dipterum]